MLIKQCSKALAGSVQPVSHHEVQRIGNIRRFGCRKAQPIAQDEREAVVRGQPADLRSHPGIGIRAFEGMRTGGRPREDRVGVLALTREGGQERFDGGALMHAISQRLPQTCPHRQPKQPVQDGLQSPVRID